MKAICIDATQTKLLKEGEVYEVVLPDIGIYNIPAYWLPALSQPYDQKRFLPLSSIDETELVTLQAATP